MKFFSFLLFTIVVSFYIKACSNDEDVRMKTAAPHGSEEIMKKAKEENAAANQRRQERVKAGDTLAMHFKKLQAYLPQSIKGYVTEDVEAQTAVTDSYSISTATRRYIKNTDEDEEPSVIEITLVDYNQAAPVFSGLTVWSTGVSFDTDERYEKTFNTGLNHVVAYEAFDRTMNKAEVTYGIAWRFILHIEANDQSSTSFIRDIANSMRLTELSNM